MTLDLIKHVEIIEIMETYFINARPPEEIKNKVDINYKVEGQSIIVFEIRPVWNNPTEKTEYNIAKITYVKKDNKWSIYWFMSDMKWHSYKPKPKVSKLKDFVKEIEEDKHGCFWG